MQLQVQLPVVPIGEPLAPQDVPWAPN